MTRLTGLIREIDTSRGNKYGARKTYVEALDRTFDSKAEAARARDLALLERAGAISNLEFQVLYVLSVKPKVTATIDFRYVENNCTVLEDTKGYQTRDSRTR